jgi:hypothetical protein
VKLPRKLPRATREAITILLAPAVVVAHVLGLLPAAATMMSTESEAATGSMTATGIGTGTDKAGTPLRRAMPGAEIANGTAAETETGTGTAAGIEAETARETGTAAGIETGIGTGTAAGTETGGETTGAGTERLC